MSMRRVLFHGLAVLLWAAGARAADISVCFWKEGGLHSVVRPMPEGLPAIQAALDALLAGPTPHEQTNGLTSAIPAGTRVTATQGSDNAVTIDFSSEILAPGLGDSMLEAIHDQLACTLRANGVQGDLRLSMGGAPLVGFLPPLRPIDVSPAPAPMKETAPSIAAGAALAGKIITLSPGHGRVWNGSGWVYERPVYCSPLSNEDLHTVNLVAYLNTYLLQDGATTKPCRCLDLDDNNKYSLTNLPWWRMSSSYWLKNIGYPVSVYANVEGDPLGSGSSEIDDGIRARPLASDRDNATLYVSVHTNGNKGDCTGSGCATGTITYYDNSSEHATWGAISQSLANAVQNSVMNVIQTKYADASWYNRGVHDSGGAYGEIRIPNRAAILLELAFHDTCDRDAVYLRDNFFRSATMWGVYSGICSYLGKTPSYDFYSDEYISDTIPAQMVPNQSYPVSITLKNRGVLWTEAKAIRLGAVGDSDPFTTATRVTVAGEIGPGSDCTFNFNLTAPAVVGTYTTDWRMVRDSVTWFGVTVSKQVEVRYPGAPGDFDQDEDVDQDDFGHLQACLSGPIAQTDPACQNAKLNGDAFIDSADVTIFRRCLSGAGQSADPNCATQ